MEVPGSGDRFNLKWNNHTMNFIQVFAEHQNAESLVDVTLSCEGQYIKAHKLILSACSDYFHSIFQVQNMPPLSVILLNGVKFKELKYIIQFMYHGEVKVLDADLPGVLALGQSLQVKGLSSVKLKNTSEGIPSSAPAAPSMNTTINYIKIAPKSDSVPFSVVPKSDLVVPSNNGPKRDIQAPVKTYLTAKPISIRPDSKLSESILPTEVPKMFSTIGSTNNVLSLQSKLGNKLINNENAAVPVNNGSVEIEQPAKRRAVEQINNQSPATNSSQIKKENIVPDSDIALKNIPLKPPNAFMIFARDWRPKLAAEFPDESTKEISLRLGNLWKTMQPEMKKVFYIAAKTAEEEHKIKYPNDNLPAKLDGRKRKSGELSGEVSPVDPLMMVEVDEEPICISEED